MFKKTLRKLEEITPKKAQELKDLEAYENQRPFSPRQFEELVSALQNDLFLTGEIGIAILIYEKNRKVVVNGQHQFAAGIAANKKFIAVYQEFQCETPADLSLLYRQFDNHKARSLSEILMVEADSVGIRWPKKTISLLMTGIILRENMTGWHKSRKLARFSAHLKFGKFLNSILTQNGKYLHITAKHIMRGAVVHAMMLMWELDERDAEKFIIDIRDGEGLNKTMPEYKVREFLKEVCVFKGRGASHIHNLATEKEITSRCITGWNAFRRQMPTDLKYYPTAPIPKAL